MNEKGLIQNIIDAPDGFAEADIINKYIAEHQPEYFRGYQCIVDDYPTKNNIRNKAVDFMSNLRNVHALPAKSIDEALAELTQLCHTSAQQQPTTSQQQQKQNPNIFPTPNQGNIGTTMTKPVGSLNMPLTDSKGRPMPQGVPENNESTDEDELNY